MEDVRREEDEDLLDRKPLKKRIKELKVLDPKMAQNLSIFLGSFRVPYEEIRRMIVENLVKHLPDPETLAALAKYQQEYSSLSEPEQFGVVVVGEEVEQEVVEEEEEEVVDEVDVEEEEVVMVSSEPRLSTCCVTRGEGGPHPGKEPQRLSLRPMSSVKRLRPRLNHLLFRLQFEEQVSNLRPDIVAVSAACDEVRKSRSFSRLLELVLLLGNYMNAGSRNAQSHGFDLSSLCKLKDTKSADQKTTLLHFLAQVCEEDFGDVVKFVDELEHVDRASRVSAENLEKSVLSPPDRQALPVAPARRYAQLYTPHLPLSGVKMLNCPGPGPGLEAVVSFAQYAREQYDKLVVMQRSMDAQYQSMVQFFSIDPKKTSVEELFTDLSNFRSMFMDGLKFSKASRAGSHSLDALNRLQKKKNALLDVNVNAGRPPADLKASSLQPVDQVGSLKAECGYREDDSHFVRAVGDGEVTVRCLLGGAISPERPGAVAAGVNSARQVVGVSLSSSFRCSQLESPDPSPGSENEETGVMDSLLEALHPPLLRAPATEG
ncbi:hypothetical protein CRUP_003510 [Coryphaenoides rupestris]|nr:hypothetical protein CRUP_003510 [Coryphaenoides rupestris]